MLTVVSEKVIKSIRTHLPRNVVYVGGIEVKGKSTNQQAEKFLRLNLRLTELGSKVSNTNINTTITAAAKHNDQLPSGCSQYAICQ